MPLIRLGLDSPTHTLADGAIKCLPVILPVLDFSTVKNEVFPPIASTFSRTNSLAIKVRCLEAFAVLCGGSMGGKEAIGDDLSGVSQTSKSQSMKSSILDKYTIQEKLVPSLKAIKTKEPAVMMAALSVFRQIKTVADTDFLALEVLPVLWSFSLGPLLDLRQFGEFMTLIKDISSKIEKEQTKKLQELSSGGDTGGFQNGTGSSSAASISTGQSNMDNTRDNFERLVLGRTAATSNDQDIDQWGSLTSGPPAVQSSTAQPTSPAGFSWPSSTTSPSAKGSMLPAQNNLSMRSITPDYSLNTFPSLAPATRAKSPPTPSFPTLQPSPSSSWSIPTPATNQQSTQRSNVSGVSLGALANMKTQAPMPSQATQAAPNYSAFSIPPPPSGHSSVGSFGSPGGLAKPGGSAFGTTASSNAFLNNSAPQATPKQGLDKYESLL